MQSIELTPGATTDECCQPATEVSLDRAQAERHTSVLKVLADPIRLQLLTHLAASCCSTACICHMPELLGISQPTLSHHLKKLTEAGLVQREMRGRWAHFTLRPDGLSELNGLLALFGR